MQTKQGDVGFLAGAIHFVSSWGGTIFGLLAAGVMLAMLTR